MKTAKKISAFLIFIAQCTLCIVNSLAQNPLVKMWDLGLGGSGNDIFTCLINTGDGGCLVGGYSGSGVSGNKTQPCWGYADYWIVKLDASGNKQWDKTFGGTLTDQLHGVIQTSDGGYLLAGYSNSGISGDKTGALKGTADYWIVKIDSVGNKLWDKDFGGTSGNILRCAEQTTDGGYILGGYSDSPIGADKTQPSNGSFDYWIIRIDSIGNKLWDKSYGGSGYDGTYFPTLKITKDGGFIVGGFSNSGISGDKTEVCFGYYDYWIVKADSIGNIEWDKDFGGTELEWMNSLAQTNDGGFLFGGVSNSPVGGNKTSPLKAGLVDCDFWVVKTDSLGNDEWQKDYGGMQSDDEFGNIFLTNDGGYLFTGNSYSSIGGDKTENNLGNEQTWAVKTDSLGNIEWDKTILTATTFDDEIGMGIQMKDGCYAFANYTNSGIGGYKSQQNFGPYDYWIVKFCDSTFMHPNPIFSAPQHLCPGTCTEFTNLSLNALAFQWSFPGASPDTSTAVSPSNICYSNSGSYSVTLIASNANGSDTLTLQNYITVYPQPPAQSITQSGDTLFAIAGSSSYQWYFNGNSIPGATDYFYVATASGDYNVVATDSNGCEVEAVINDVIASAQAAVGSGSMQSIQVYPNPVTTTLDIRGLKNNSADEIKIFNVYGEKVFSAVNCKLLPINIGTNCQLLPSGLYYLEIISDKKIYRTKFIKSTYR